MIDVVDVFEDMHRWRRRNGGKFPDHITMSKNTRIEIMSQTTKPDNKELFGLTIKTDNNVESYVFSRDAT